MDVKDGTPHKVNPDYFTGETSLMNLSTKMEVKESRIFHVEFSGSMTKTHTHTQGQLLIPTKGTGTLIFYKKTEEGIKIDKEFKLVVGTVQYIPAKTLHAHGSFSKKNFSHIAINYLSTKRREPVTIWYDLKDGKIKKI